MNPDVKAQWVAALRSGEYQQTTGALRRPTPEVGQLAFCCLGVLCDISGIGQWSDAFYAGDGGTLPDPVSAWAGIGVTDPVVRLDSGRTTCLSSLNDGTSGNERHTFEQIADLIEAQL